eukprot:gene14722-31299_t
MVPWLLTTTNTNTNPIPSTDSITTTITASTASSPIEKKKEKLVIHVHPTDGAEVMHGVGARLTSRKDGEGDVVAEGSCKGSTLLSNKQRESFVASEKVFSALEAMFGDGVRKKTVTELADAALPNRCHDMALPCSSTNTDG